MNHTMKQWQAELDGNVEMLRRLSAEEGMTHSETAIAGISLRASARNYVDNTDTAHEEKYSWILERAALAYAIALSNERDELDEAIDIEMTNARDRT